MRMIASLIAMGTGCYVLLNFMQDRMVFLARLPGRELEATPRHVGFEYIDVNFETTDGLSLHGWYVYAHNSRGTVLFLHGNAGNISHRLDSIVIFHELGLDTFIIDYRGYGRSEGKPSEEGTYRDAEAAWQYLVTDRGEDPVRIVMFGRSIGGGVAAWLATRHKAAALIVESSFTSAVEMAARLDPFMPVRLITRLRGRRFLSSRAITTTDFFCPGIATAKNWRISWRITWKTVQNRTDVRSVREGIG